MTGLIPTNGNIVAVLEDPPDQFSGSLLQVPESVKDKNQEVARVVATGGPTVRNAKGVTYEHGIEPGDRVLMNVKFAGATVHHEGVEYVILPISEVAAVLP